MFSIAGYYRDGELPEEVALLKYNLTINKEMIIKSINDVLESLFSVRIKKTDTAEEERRRLEEKRRNDWIKEGGFDCIIDVGANEGQFAIFIKSILTNVPIYSFEPIQSVYEVLVKNLNFKDAKAFNFALGREAKKVEINLNQFTPGSSILELAETHKSNFPFATETKKTSVEVRKLDEFREEFKTFGNIFLKIDVQGYEKEVLDGGTEMLKKCRAVLIEICFETLFENQPLFKEINRFLEENGFEFHGVSEQTSGNKGLPLFADGIYIRK